MDETTQFQGNLPAVLAHASCATSAVPGGLNIRTVVIIP